MHYKKMRFDFSILAIILSLSLCAVLFFSLVDMPEFLSRATEYSAAVVLPAGETSSALQSRVSSQNFSEINSVDISGEVNAVIASGAASLSQGLYPVIEETREDSGDITEENGIKVINKTSASPDINIAEIKELFEATEGIVLIYHTHASEAYSDGYTGSYNPDAPIYSDDESKTVIAAGNALAEALKSAGISVIHDTSVFDNPSNSGAYMRAATRLKALLTENPNISYMIDIHRGVIQQTGGARIKPTVTIGESKAAQLSIITGCDITGKLGLPDWEKNLSFALNLQQVLNEYSPLISRPIALEERNYNFDLCENSVCIEIGTDTNTAEEAALTARIVGESLAAILS